MTASGTSDEEPLPSSRTTIWPNYQAPHRVRGGEGPFIRWASLLAVALFHLVFPGAAMADDYFAESFHDASGRYAILQLDGSVAYLYLTVAGSQKPEKDVAVFSTGELVEPEVAVASAKQGKPPPLVARYASDSAVYPAETFWKLRFLWSEDGNSVAVLLDGVPLAYASAHEKSGKSKALKAASFFGEPWSDESYQVVFAR